MAGDPENFGQGFGLYGRTAWECPRCHKINAPHIDHCDCVGEPTSKETIINPYIPQYPPYIVPWPTYPYLLTYLGPYAPYSGQIIITCETTTNATGKEDAV